MITKSKQKKSNRCSRCGRILRDPVSLALGMGRECRGGGKGLTCRQVARNNCLRRGQAYFDHTPVVFRNITYTFDVENKNWTSANSNAGLTDERFKEFLKQHNLAVFPDEYLDSLRFRRDLIVETLEAILPEYNLSLAERAELEEELHIVQDILDKEE